MSARLGRVDAVWFVYQKVKALQALGCTQTDPFRPTFESLCVGGVSFVTAESDQNMWCCDTHVQRIAPSCRIADHHADAE